MKKFLKGLIDENPLFVLCLGMCPALAITTTFENGYLMGLSLMLVLLLSNVVINIVSRFIDDHIKIPAYIMIIATFVTVLELVLQKYGESLYLALGIYLPLITVNCIVLGRAISYASKHKLVDTIVDSLKIGIGYALALALVGLIRELLGSNTITLMDKISDLTGYISKFEVFPKNDFLPNQLFLTPAGAFLTIGLLLGLFNALRRGKEDTK